MFCLGWLGTALGSYLFVLCIGPYAAPQGTPNSMHAVSIGDIVTSALAEDTHFSNKYFSYTVKPLKVRKLHYQLLTIAHLCCHLDEIQQSS